ncbi:MAG: tRNA guanosine(15) transglycosylase TgtA [Thermoplasmata archaeon]|nr:tRNA guanosine(15) transglycosylase TgtA [Thermoplasmata archaeon]MCI4358961.1 tRNA guanosine(15) transglycosylase TgtA [Thermoplasmata archaeon]
MGEFELRERDGLARIGRFPTPHGAVETPALLPVVHPDPARQPIPPSEIRRRFGLAAVITSAYITWRTPPLREIAESRGIHALLDFDGPVMTDSGAFQQHAYGQVEVSDAAIFSFQRRIGSDIATVLDVFTEPDAPQEVALRAIEETSLRAKQARSLHKGLLAVPVQGGLHAPLRFRSASEASEIGDVLAVGGVVPLMEQYRFADLARVLIAVRPGLSPGAAVHLFGTGHPMTFAFAALFGVDLFDSAAYLKFARRGALMFPDGTVPLQDVREAICRCALCEAVPLTEVARMSDEDRVVRVAEHNLLQCAQEVSLVRQAIRDATLWELAERRAASHPALQVGLRTAVRGVRTFLPTEPESRRSFRVVGPTSGLRPSVIRFLAQVERWKEGRGPYRDHPRVPLTPGGIGRTPTETRSGASLLWETQTAIGRVPLELTEIYPVGCYLGLEEFESRADRAESVASADGLDADLDRDYSKRWAERQLRATFEWVHGREGANEVLSRGLVGERSTRTGRLRGVVREGNRLFTIGNDGLPRPTWLGAELVHAARAFPAQRIIADSDAVPFVEEGRSLFSRFVKGGDSSLIPGSSALVVDESDRLLAVGRLVLAPPEMGRIPRAVAVRVVAHRRRPDGEPDPEAGGPESPVGPDGRDL